MLRLQSLQCVRSPRLARGLVNAGGLTSGGDGRQQRSGRRVREDWDERHTHTRKSRRLQGEASEEENYSSHVPIEVERDQSVRGGA